MIALGTPLALASPASARGTLTTAPAKTPKTGAGPSAVVTADFNGDGRDDIAFTNSGDDNVDVLLGQGDGSFKAAPGGAVSVGDDPEDLAVGDFNGDGVPDLATANHDSSDVSVLIGQANGHMVLSGTYVENIPGDFTYGAGSGIAVGQFNPGTAQDIVVTSLGPGGRGEAETFLGNGAGGFSTATLITNKDSGIGSGGPIAVSDFDRDGIDDLALLDTYTGASDGRVDILLGNGSNAFTYQSAIAAGTSLQDLVVGDFNGGAPDFATIDDSDDSVAVRLGTNGSSFNTPPGDPFGVAETPRAITTGDFDGDGAQDLAVANADVDKATILLGSGGGTFEAQSPIAAGDEPEALSSGDFDGDARSDLAVLDFNSNSVTVLISSESRKLSLKFKKGKFSGKLGSKSKSCQKSQKVTVFEKRPGKDHKVGDDKTSSSGVYSVKDKGGKGSYYASTPASKSSGLGCLAAESKTQKLK